MIDLPCMRDLARHLAVAFAMATVVPLAAQAAPTVVNVDLRDQASNRLLSGMAIRADHTKLRAGNVTFLVTNKSRTLVHEMILVQLDRADQALPYDATENKVIEEKIHDLGEIPELAPGKSGSLKVTLAPGTYALLCNQPGHFHAGMLTVLTAIP
jgi:uncharacterized cupredoxin-like copper-binding protein